MWEEEPKMPEKQRETRLFLDWMKEYVLRPEHVGEAEKIIRLAEEDVPEIKRFLRTPQSPPWHSEGTTLWHHVRRILAGVNAVLAGAELSDIEEFAREKDLAGEIDEITHTIRENAGSMIAFALVHDIAKPDTLWFDAPPDSKGAREGFLQHKHRKREVANADEQAHYLKLVRSFALKTKTDNQEEITSLFFDHFEIKAHFTGHDRLGASDAFMSAREALGGTYHLSASDLVMLHFAIKHHIDFLNAFHVEPSVPKFKLLVRRANRAGLDADDFLDLLLAFTFIDTTIGSLGYSDGNFVAQTQVIVNFLRSEFEAAPERKARRLERQALHERRLRKAAFEAARLTGEEVFALLDIPFGPRRGRVIEQIHAWVDDPSLTFDFGYRTDELRERIEMAHQLLTRQ